MSKHTKGPWALHVKSNGTSQRHVQILNDDVFIAVAYFTNSINETNANARLIAAAPELLEALIDCRRTLEIANFTQELAVVNAAIAKANGEQFPQPSKKTGGDPCGECHLQAGETCDICGAIAKAQRERRE